VIRPAAVVAVFLSGAAACNAPPAPAPAPAVAQPAPRAEPFELLTQAVALFPEAPDRTTLGPLTYVGGLVLTARGTSRFGGLSGLDGDSEGLVAVTDAGDLVRFRVRLDRSGGVVGASDAALAGLLDVSGAPLSGDKQEGDAEGLVVDAGGLTISFEHRHRILAFADASRPGQRLPSPDARALPANEGMEGLAAYDDDALLVGGESGRFWICPRTGETCRDAPLTRDFDDSFKPTGLDRIGDERRWVGVFRAFDPVRGPRVVVAEVLPAAEGGFTARELARLTPPATVDNFEAVAAEHRPGGAVRLYLLSDDNFSARQRTLLLAFDWRPNESRP
jgi:hypothetical protein